MRVLDECARALVLRVCVCRDTTVCEVESQEKERRVPSGRSACAAGRGGARAMGRRSWSVECPGERCVNVAALGCDARVAHVALDDLRIERMI